MKKVKTENNDIGSLKNSEFHSNGFHFGCFDSKEKANEFEIKYANDGHKIEKDTFQDLFYRLIYGIDNEKTESSKYCELKNQIFDDCYVYGLNVENQMSASQYIALKKIISVCGLFDEYKEYAQKRDDEPLPFSDEY